MWNDKLPDGSYYVSDIQDYFEYILKNMEERLMTDNSSIRNYANEKENRTKFKIKTGYYLQLLTPETMKLLGNTKVR